VSSRSAGRPFVRVTSLALLLSAALCASSFAAPPPAAYASPAPLAIALGDHSLTIAPLTPGARAVLLGVDRESETFFFNDTHYVDAQAESGGTATFSIDRGITPLSVWIAVDAATGQAAVSTPAGSPYRARPSAAKSANARASSIAIDGPAVDLVLVRPGTGAWRISAGDGAALDADRLQDQTLTLAAADLEPLDGSAAAPSELAARDLLIGIDAQRQEYFVVEVQP
jgi:hypothetical protein